MKIILADALNTFVIKGEGVYQPLYDLLDTYANPKVIVTNANDAQLIEFGIVNMPYPVFTCKHDPDKTDPEYFVRLLREYNLKPEDVVYFEHNDEAVKSAQSLGVAAYWYDKDARNLGALKEFLDGAMGV